MPRSRSTSARLLLLIVLSFASLPAEAQPQAEVSVRVEENFKSQVEKYTQRFCNTPFSDHQFDEEEFAIICVLLLRGPRTPGELKANVGRLHRFADNGEVEAALKRLLEPEEGSAVVVQLPRTPGRRDNEYMHLFSGPLEAARAGRAAACVASHSSCGATGAASP